MTSIILIVLKIAIIGTGNVGSALAAKWADAGHRIYLGVRNIKEFKGSNLRSKNGVSAHLVAEAVHEAEVVLLATPAKAAVEVARSLGDTTGKIIIDAMNIVMNQGPAGYANTGDAILSNTASRDVVKCFNTTGYNNMNDTVYGNTSIDMFMAGDSKPAKAFVRQLALEAGFAECYDVGGNDKFSLMEQFAFFWINLAMFQGQGRNIAFKLLKR